VNDSIKDEVLAAATIADVLRMANIEPPANERKNIRCPLHADSAPSFSVQKSDKGWKCFAGCGEGGVFDLVVALKLAATTSAAVDLLADHYGIAKSGADGSYKPGVKKRKPLPQFELKVVEPIPTLTSEKKAELANAVRGCQPLLGTPGVAYLKGRGFDPDTADACEVRYHPKWLGIGPAVVFPCRTSEGVLVAAQGRFLSPSEKPKARSIGKVSLGVFSTPGALKTGRDGLDGPIGITEAPLDALALAVSGMPAVALCGAENRVYWLRKAFARKDVVIAMDFDQKGEECAEKLRDFLNLGTSKRRMTFAGCKDAAELLEKDPAMLSTLVGDMVYAVRSRYWVDGYAQIEA
jgi:DNA primase